MPIIYLHYELHTYRPTGDKTLQLQTSGSNQKDNLLKLLKPIFLTAKKGGYEADLSAPFIIGTFDPKTKVAKSFITETAPYGAILSDPLFDGIVAQFAKSLKSVSLSPYGETTLTFKRQAETEVEGENYFNVLLETVKKTNETAKMQGFWQCTTTDNEITFTAKRCFIIEPKTDVTYINLESV